MRGRVLRDCVLRALFGQAPGHSTAPALFWKVASPPPWRNSDGAHPLFFLFPGTLNMGNSKIPNISPLLPSARPRRCSVGISRLIRRRGKKKKRNTTNVLCHLTVLARLAYHLQQCIYCPQVSLPPWPWGVATRVGSSITTLTGIQGFSYTPSSSQTFDHTYCFLNNSSVILLRVASIHTGVHKNPQPCGV